MLILKLPAVYILTNQSHSTLYIGVTSDLIKRVFQHKNHLVQGFTQKYNVERLVYFEQFEDMENAIKREKTLKKWLREWKNELITQSNPNWVDLWNDIIQ